MSLSEREMRARLHVVGEVLAEHPLQPSLVHDDDVIQALPSDRPDDALDVGVLPRRARRSSNPWMFMPAMVVATSGEDRIAIVQEIPGRLVVREGVAKLLCRPGRRGMVGDGHVNDPSTLVREDDEHEEQPERDGRHDEEVGGHDLARVVGEERSPRL